LVHFLGFDERHDEWINVEKDMHRIKDPKDDDNVAGTFHCPQARSDATK